MKFSKSISVRGILAMLADINLHYRIHIKKYRLRLRGSEHVLHPSLDDMCQRHYKVSTRGQSNKQERTGEVESSKNNLK